MPKEFNCPSCSVPIVFQGGESIFQTCQACHAPVVVPSEFLYGKGEQLASENFASLVNDKPVNVEQVTNELTPGSSLPKEEDSLESYDPDARIEKFEVYQEKIGTHAVQTKQAVDEIVSPQQEMDFKTASPFANADGSMKTDISEKKSLSVPINPVIARINNELEAGDKIEAIKIFRNRFNTSLREAKEVVEAIERGENIDISQYAD